jgi:hypothetical protein
MGTSRAALAGLMLALIAPAYAGRPAPTGPLRFIADDPSAALNEAKRRGVPVFVEAWAPW